MIKFEMSYRIHDLLIATLASAIIFVSALPTKAETTVNDEHHTTVSPINVYTHGNTSTAQINGDGTVSGKLNQLLHCASSHLGFEYEIKFAPMSRGWQLIETAEHVAWFPAALTDNTKEITTGPLANLDIVWYQLKTSGLDVNSPTFKQNARVSAYKGSVFETSLLEQGYDFVPGNSDHNRMIYMLLTGTVDALLALDFRSKLNEQTQQIMDTHIKITTQKKVPVYLALSRHMVSGHPEFVEIFKSQIMSCSE